MAGVLQHLRSSTLNKRPNPASMVDGQIAINYASGSPGAFFKDTNGNLVKVGPVHVGATAPNVSPASGGTAGNSLGEQWLDTSGGTYVFKIWDGAAWRSEAGEFVNSTGDTMTGSLAMGPSANLIFEGSTDDGFETTLTVVDPTADRTITLPNVSGTVVTTGDSGTVTSAMIADGTIVNADVNASAAIAGTKISPDFGSQTIQTTGVFSHSLGSASSPTVTFTGDTNTGIYSPGADQVAISTGGSGRLFVDASGRVGIGTTSPLAGNLLDVRGAVVSTQHFRSYVSSSDANSIRGFRQTIDGNELFALYHSNSAAVFEVNSAERARIDSSGRLLVGTSTAAQYNNYSSVMPVHIAGTGDVDIQVTAFRNDQYSGGINFSKSRGATVGANASVADGDIVGNLRFFGADGTNWISAGTIQCRIDGTPGTNDMPGRLVFSTTADGASSPTERLRITSAGNVGIGTASPGRPLEVNGIIRTTVTGTTSDAAQAFEINNSNAGVDPRVLVLSGTNNGSAIIRNASTTAGGIQFQIQGGEVARIDSSGRFLVGTSTAYAVSGFSRHHYFCPTQGEVNNHVIVGAASTGFPGLFFTRTRAASANSAATAVQNGDVLGNISFYGANGTDFSNQAAVIECIVDGDPFTVGDTTDLPGRLVFSTTADGASSPTERMRITSAGNIRIGQTSTDTPGNGNTTTGIGMEPANGALFLSRSDGSCNLFLNSNLSTGTADAIIFRRSNVAVGSVSTTTTSTSYNTSSDYRLKESITPVTDGITRLQQLKPSRFNFIADPAKTVDGFIAHEVQAVVPEAITGEKDAVDDEGNPQYQGIDQSKLVPLLTAALQEAVAKIESLEARLTAAGI